MPAPVTAKSDRLIAEELAPTGRWGEEEDVAKVVTSLAAGAFAYAPGSVIDVRDGLSINRF